MQQRHSCVCTQHEYDSTHKDYTADLSNGFAVTDEDLQRAIDDTEIEEKLPNEPKTTAVAKAASKPSVNASSDTNAKSTQASLKALEMLGRGCFMASNGPDEQIAILISDDEKSFKILVALGITRILAR